MCHHCNRESIAILAERLARVEPQDPFETQAPLRDLAFLLTHAVTGDDGDDHGNDNTDADVEAIAGRLAMRSANQLRRLASLAHYWADSLEYIQDQLKVAVVGLAEGGDPEARAMVVGMALDELATNLEAVVKQAVVAGTANPKVAARHLN